MKFRRLTLAVAAALLIALPQVASAHDDYDDPFENHPFKWAGELGYIAGYTADQLVFRPLHWIINKKPASTVTGHDEMDTRLPPPDLEDIH